MSGVAAAAKASADIGRDAMEWYQKAYEDQTPVRNEATQLSLQQARLQNQSATKQLAAADESLEYQKTTFRPV
ncbi:MAG: hypothetical protein EOO24_63215, partial [Comamonadaceae bacterium]